MNEPQPLHRQSILGFTIEEATALLNQHMIRERDIKKKPNPQHIGFVAGVLTLNDEIEIVVKFFDEVLQFTKSEYQSQLVQLND